MIDKEKRVRNEVEISPNQSRLIGWVLKKVIDKEKRVRNEVEISPNQSRLIG